LAILLSLLRAAADSPTTLTARLAPLLYLLSHDRPAAAKAFSGPRGFVQYSIARLPLAESRHQGGNE